MDVPRNRLNPTEIYLCSAFPVGIALSNFWFVPFYLTTFADYNPTILLYTTQDACSASGASAERFQRVLYMRIFWSFGLIGNKAVCFHMILSAACHTTWTLSLFLRDSFQLKSERRNTVEQTFTSQRFISFAVLRPNPYVTPPSMSPAFLELSSQLQRR